LAYSCGFKNNGPDDVLTGDSLFYQFVLLQGNNPITVVPQSGLFFRVLTRDVPNGDTIHLRRNFNINARANFSINVTMRVTGLVLNRAAASPLGPETGTAANNTLNENIIWYNQQGWGVSVSEVDNQKLISLYPNPANGQVTIEWAIESTEVEETTINIYDLNGRLVRNITANSFVPSVNIETEDLDNGLYTVEVINGPYRSTGKLNILH
jgi:hypothetical protein